MDPQRRDAQIFMYGYARGFVCGRTIQEIDNYYQGLLREIEELEKMLVDSGPSSVENRSAVLAA